VCFSCVDSKKFRLAANCGVHIIVMMDHLQDLVHYYEARGHFEELIQLLEQGLNLDRVHQGIYTNLGVVYSRYKEDKLMDHIKFFHQRLNMTTLLQECRKSLHWPEVVFLYSHWDQYDNAVDTMIQHSADCWDNKHFKELLLSANSEVIYRAIDFYIEEHPTLVNELLTDLFNKLEAGRVVMKFRQSSHLPLIKKYLLLAQRENLSLVNEAVNELLLAEDDYEGLRASVDKYTDFDQIALAQRVERHELLQFRRIAALLYRLNKKYSKSIEVCKRDNLWQDATETAAESGKAELAEELLRFFVSNENSSSFAATLFACYDLIKPDVVLELAWRNNLMDFAMPYMIQTMSSFNTKLTGLSDKIAAGEKKEADEAAAQQALEDEENDLYNPVVNLISAPPADYNNGGGGGNQYSGGQQFDNSNQGAGYDQGYGGNNNNNNGGGLYDNNNGGGNFNNNNTGYDQGNQQQGGAQGNVFF